MSDDQRAVTVAELRKLQEWLREPDNAELFGTAEVLEWINRRPTHVIPAAVHQLTASPSADYRALLIEAGRNAGAYLDDRVSYDFLKIVPEEVRLKIAALEKRGAEAVIAYHVAICSPKGVVPDDALYDAAMAADVQAALDAGLPVRTGKCRGHDLADPVAWEPEVGSVAALAQAKAGGA